MCVCVGGGWRYKLPRIVHYTTEDVEGEGRTVLMGGGGVSVSCPGLSTTPLKMLRVGEQLCGGGQLGGGEWGQHRGCTWLPTVVQYAAEDIQSESKRRTVMYVCVFICMLGGGGGGSTEISH